MAVHFRQLHIVAVICLLSAHLFLPDTGLTAKAAGLTSVSVEPVSDVAAGLTSVSVEPVGTVAAGLSSVSVEPEGTAAAGLSRSGPIDAGMSSVMTDKQVTAGEVTTVMMTLVDTSGLPVTELTASQFEITFSDDYTRVVDESFKEVTPGVYRVQVLKLASGVLRIDIRVDGVLLDEQPEITYVHGPPVYIEIIRAPTGMTAGELVDPLSVIVVDRLGNPVPGIEVTVELEDDNEFLAGTLVHTTDRDGFVEFNDLVLTNSGQFRFILSAEGVDPVTSDPIDNRPEAPDPSRSVISAEPVTIVAGEESSLITVTLYDRYGNLRYRGGDEVYLITDFGELSPVVDRGFGRYTAQLTGESVGVATIIGYLGSSEEGDPLGYVEVALIEKGDDSDGDPGDGDGSGGGGDPGGDDGGDDDGGDDDGGDDDDGSGGDGPGNGPGDGSGSDGPGDGSGGDEPGDGDGSDGSGGDGSGGNDNGSGGSGNGNDNDPESGGDGGSGRETGGGADKGDDDDGDNLQNYPNPWRGSTTIRFRIPERSAVVIEVFDVIGRRVETLVQESSMEAGVHQMQWNASRLSGGVYICRMVVTEVSGARYMQSRQMTLVK